MGADTLQASRSAIAVRDNSWKLGNPAPQNYSSRLHVQISHPSAAKARSASSVYNFLNLTADFLRDHL